MLKQQEAKERQDLRNKKSPKDILNQLDSIFGKNLGAKKERQKLQNVISKETESKKEQKEQKENKKSKKAK